MATATLNGKTVIIPMKPSTELVLNVMRARPLDGACGATFVENGSLRYSARILELREMGFEITAEPCAAHLHPNPLNAYRVETYNP